MASKPPENSPRHLLTLGMFVFGMDSLAYDQLERRMDWRHPSNERFQARPVSQYAGPGADTISLTGMLVPGVAGTFAELERLVEMADSGDNWPLIDGDGNVLGQFRILGIDQRQQAIMAGGKPRKTDFAVDLERAD